MGSELPAMKNLCTHCRRELRGHAAIWLDGREYPLCHPDGRGMNCYRLVTVFQHAVVDCRVCRHLSTEVEHPDRPTSKVLTIPTDATGYDPSWSPAWAQMIDLIERYAVTKTSSLEEEWLRDHPIEWMRAVQAKIERVKLQIQQSRAQLKDTPHVIEVDGVARTSRKYVSLKAETEQRNARRQSFLLRLDEQKKEAKNNFGYDPVVSRAEIAEALLQAKAALDGQTQSDRPGPEEAHAILDAVIYWLHEGHSRTARTPPSDTK